MWWVDRVSRLDRDSLHAVAINELFPPHSNLASILEPIVLRVHMSKRRVDPSFLYRSKFGTFPHRPSAQQSLTGHVSLPNSCRSDQFSLPERVRFLPTHIGSSTTHRF